MECNIKNFSHVLLFLVFIFSVLAEETKVRFVPSHYKLEIITEQKHFQDSADILKYTGAVTVEFKKVGTLPTGKDFEIKLDTNPKTDVRDLVLKGGTKKENIKYLNKKVENKKLVITVSKEYTNVELFELTVNFENPFGNDMNGFYRSSYKEKVDDREITRWLLTTHFEPIYARNAFPCFDQPDLKATFEINITVPEDIKTVLSNTPVKPVNTTVSEEKKKVFLFEKTSFPMSTYLVAFTASNLGKTETEEFNNKQNLTTYGRSEIISKGKLPQKVAKEAVELLGKYLDNQYSFGKIDQVGIPDFSAGAMENWGHISFREKSLFFDTESSTNTKQANTLTIVHELVHQWFGNLVTLESWDYIWLNEAFANYLEYVIGSEITDSKNWKLMDQMLVNEIHLRAFEADGFNSSKPLNFKIADENLIVSFFNDISYSKGSAILRMWDSLMKDKFQTALKEYISKRKGQTTNPQELYKYLQDDLKKNLFEDWTDKPGYPVVSLTKINSTHYNLTQTRFLWDKAEDNTVWLVPIKYTVYKEKKPTKYETELEDKPLSVKKDWDWVIVNDNQFGYYRVNYDKENWMALSNALAQKDYSGIPELNRAQIVNDIFSLARSLQKEYVQYSTALNLIKYLQNENSFIVWKTALNNFDFLRTKVHKENIYPKFQEFVLSLAKPHFKSLTPESNANHVDKLMNVEISRWLCSLGYKNCTDEALKLYKNSEYKKNSDMKEIILCTVVANDSKVWEEVFKNYLEEKDSSVKLMYLSALGCSGDETVINGYLEKTLDKNSVIRKQDFKYVLSSVYNGNLLNVETALKFIETNFKKIATEYGGLDPLGGALIGIAKKLKSKDQLTRLEKLVKNIKDSTEAAASINNAEVALTIAKSNLNWVQSRMEQVKTYFNSGSLLSYSFALLLLCLISVFQF